MKSLKLLLFGTLILGFQFFSLFASPENSGECKILIRIERLKNPFHQNDSKWINLLITNKNKNSILIPESLYEGDDFYGEIELVFEIIRKDQRSGKYEYILEKNDYLNVISERNSETIAPLETKKLKQAIDLVNLIDLCGEYKIRAKVKISGVSTCGVITTEWIKFKIIN